MTHETQTRSLARNRYLVKQVNFSMRGVQQSEEYCRFWWGVRFCYSMYLALKGNYDILKPYWDITTCK